MSEETITCMACGKPEHADLIDAKDEGTGNYTILHCIACYGPGWLPACGSRESWKVSVQPSLRRHYIAWRMSEQAVRIGLPGFWSYT